MHRLLRGLAVLAALPLIALPTAEAATVLMISPLTTNMQDELQGSMCETNTCVVVDAPAYPDPRGVIALDNAIKSTPGEIIVFGYSNGAQIVSQWLTQHANDPTAPSPDRLSFVLIGNPTRAYGGTSAPMPQTKYLVTDIAREYDVAADYPNNPKSRYYSLAVNNAWAGFFSIHANYWDVNQYDPANLVWTVGNTTYVLVPTAVPPLCASPCPKTKAQIDQAYNRKYPGLQTAKPAPAGTTRAAASPLSASVVSDPMAVPQDATVSPSLAPTAADSVSPSTQPQNANGGAVADTVITTTAPDRADVPDTVTTSTPLATQPGPANAVAATQSTTARTTYTTDASSTRGDKVVTGKAGGNQTTSGDQATSAKRTATSTRKGTDATESNG